MPTKPHPGRMFIPDSAAAKAWQLPLRLVWTRHRDQFKLIDAGEVTVRRFKRWRYAYQAYLYLCAVHHQDALDEDAARRELYRDSWERSARANASFKRSKADVSAAGRAKRNQVRQERAKRSTAFWARFGGKPTLPTG